MNNVKILFQSVMLIPYFVTVVLLFLILLLRLTKHSKAPRDTNRYRKQEQNVVTVILLFCTIIFTLLNQTATTASL